MFDFMKYRYLYFVFSLLFILPGVFFLLRYGLRPSIDFTGGSLLQVQVVQKDPKSPVPLTQDSLQKVVGDKYQIESVQSAGPNDFILRGKPITNAEKDVIVAQLQPNFAAVREESFQTVGPILGQELIQKTLVAGILVGLIIITYIWRQFHSLKYGVAAVAAMFHDAFVVLGAFSIFGYFYKVEVDVLFVTALLTILSFSVHDTIIVFDRIRETMKKHGNVPYREVVNSAVLQTLSRSINNSMTIIIMLSTLVLLGGSTIRWFAVALLIGAITGTYSSTFNAAPILLVWDDVAAYVKKMRQKRK